MAAPVVQIIERADYKTHYLVTLPNDPLPPLPPSSVRVRTEIFSLSINNFTYARLGHLLGWWDVHPLPENTPAPFNDASKYGRLACWGIGVVTASTSSLAPVGTKIYGYLPAGTLEVDKQIIDPGVTGQIVETTEHRKNLLQGFYNRYFIVPQGASESDLEWDSLMKVLFETSYLINRYAFSWDPQVHAPVFPTGNIPNHSWSAEDADLTDAIVLVFAASTKTAGAFAQQVKIHRPKEHQPRVMIGVGSEGSKATSEALGWYDDVLLYSDDPVATLKAKAGLDAKTKVVIFDYGSRGAAGIKWAAAVKGNSKSVKVISIASSPDAGMERADFTGLEDAPPILGTALGLREGAMENMGGERYYEEMEDAWRTFKANGGLPGVEFDIKDGLDAFKKDWEDLAAETISPTKALLYRI